MMQNRLSTSLSMIQSVWADYRYGLLIVLVMVTFLPFRPVGSPDTWKHLVDGQYLSWFHAMPHYSTFTLTPVKEVIPGDSYDWLGSLILYQVYHGGGYTGLQLLRLVVPCTMLFLLVSLNERRCDGIWFLSSLVVIYGLEATYDVRASVFGPIVFGLELYLLIKFHDTKRLRYLWFVPPVLMVWGNLHGSYLIGIYVFLLFVLGFFMDRVFSDSQDWSLKNMVSCGLIVLLTFVAVIYVKPFPNYEPVQRLNGVLEFFRVQPRRPVWIFSRP